MPSAPVCPSVRPSSTAAIPPRYPCCWVLQAAETVFQPSAILSPSQSSQVEVDAKLQGLAAAPAEVGKSPIETKSVKQGEIFARI